MLELLSCLPFLGVLSFLVRQPLSLQHCSLTPGKSLSFSSCVKVAQQYRSLQGLSEAPIYISYITGLILTPKCAHTERHLTPTSGVLFVCLWVWGFFVFVVVVILIERRVNFTAKKIDLKKFLF